MIILQDDVRFGNDPIPKFRRCGNFDGVQISIGWKFRLCGNFDGVEISMVWKFRRCGNFDGVEISTG